MTTLAAGSPASTSEGTSHRAVLAAMSACAMLVVAFVASINLAVPKLAASGLHPSASSLLWIVDTYVVLFACLVIPGGAVGDRRGRKGVLLAGTALFALGALVSAVAPDVAVMLVGRAVTGVGAAAVLPNSLAVLLHAMPAERRQHAISVWAGATGIGGAVGNVGGGLVLQNASYHWLFGAAALLALACGGWAARVSPRTARSDRALDPAGAVLVTLASVALLLGIIEGPQDGWTSWQVLAGFCAAVALFALWVVVELRVAHPLLDPRLFRIPLLRGSCLGMFVAFFGLFGLFYVNASYLQYARGFGLLRTGFAILPVVVPLLLGARYAPRVAARVSGPVLVAVAFGFIGGGLIGLSSSARHEPYAVYALWLVVVGIGIALALPVLTTEIAGSLPAAQAGVGAGLQSTTREMGSALGVAVIGTILTSRFAAALPHGLGHGGANTVAGALGQAGPVAGLRHQVLAAYASSTAHAMLVIGLVVLVAGALVTLQTAWSGRRT